MIERKTVEFWSETDACQGDLYLPPGFDPGRAWPALVIGHGFAVARTSLVKEGKLFAAAGYVTLAIDYRHFGGSGGTPRHDLHPNRQVEDFRNAIDWLERQPGVDRERIGLWGTSFGGGIATQAAALDLRVQACVAQAPILDGDTWLRQLNRESDYLAIRNYLIETRRRRAAGVADQAGTRIAGSPIHAGQAGEGPRMTVGGATEDGFCPMPPDQQMIDEVMAYHAETDEYPMDIAPDITVASYERTLAFDAVRGASRIAPRAYCIVQLTGRDIYHPQSSIQEAYRNAGEPKEMVSLRMDQLDCYKHDGRAQTVGAAIAFFDRHLKPGV
jgi:dienelactone hydrolase